MAVCAQQERAPNLWEPPLASVHRSTVRALVFFLPFIIFELQRREPYRVRAAGLAREEHLVLSVRLDDARRVCPVRAPNNAVALVEYRVASIARERQTIARASIPYPVVRPLSAAAIPQVERISAPQHRAKSRIARVPWRRRAPGSCAASRQRLAVPIPALAVRGIGDADGFEPAVGSVVVDNLSAPISYFVLFVRTSGHIARASRINVAACSAVSVLPDCACTSLMNAPMAPAFALALPLAAAASAARSFASIELATPGWETKLCTSAPRLAPVTLTVKVVEPEPTLPATSVAVAEKVFAPSGNE